MITLFSSDYICAAWTAPIQVTICLIILLVQLGPSALAGFSLFLLIMPVQERVMSFQFALGKKTLKWTDARSRLILEVLGTYIIPSMIDGGTDD